VIALGHGAWVGLVARAYSCPVPHASTRSAQPTAHRLGPQPSALGPRPSSVTEGQTGAHQTGNAGRGWFLLLPASGPTLRKERPPCSKPLSSTLSRRRHHARWGCCLRRS